MSIFYAHSFQMGVCGDPECTALHFILKDEDGKDRAMMAIGVEHIPSVIKDMQGHAYSIITLRGDLNE